MVNKPTKSEGKGKPAIAPPVPMDPRILTPYGFNAKKHEPEQVTKLANILKEYGPDQPIVVDENHVILKGHGRRLAAIEAGLETFPVIVRTGLTEEEKRILRLSDNKVNESPWDDKLLIAELAYLQEAESDLSLTAFDSEEIDRLFQELEGDTDGQLYGDGGSGKLFTDDEPGSGIPSGNKPINENKLRTSRKHECPECGYQW